MQICTEVPKYAKICIKNRVPKCRTNVKTPFLSFSLQGISAYKTCICMFLWALIISFGIIMNGKNRKKFYLEKNENPLKKRVGNPILLNLGLLMIFYKILTLILLHLSFF